MRKRHPQLFQQPWPVHLQAAEQEWSVREVPVLCHHNFTESTNIIIAVSHERFEEHTRSLVDSGYHGILPDQLYDYLAAEADLASKQVVISFDDSRI